MFAFGYSFLRFTFTETDGTSHKGNFSKPCIFLAWDFQGYSAGCLEHLHMTYDSLIHRKDLGIWRKANLGRKLLFGAAFPQGLQQCYTGHVGPSKVLSFSPLPAPNFEFQKSTWAFWREALDSLLECSAFILIFLSPGQSISSHPSFIHQLQDVVKRGPELYSQRVVPQHAALHPFLWRLCSSLTRTEKEPERRKSCCNDMMCSYYNFRYNLSIFAKQAGCWL